MTKERTKPFRTMYLGIIPGHPGGHGLIRPTSDGEDDMSNKKLVIDTEREEDGRWIATIEELPGVMCYGETEEMAIKDVRVLALRVIAGRLENNETLPDGLVDKLNLYFAVTKPAG